MKDAGITAPVPRGDWQANVNYYFLNIVNHNGISWIAKRENMGQEPSDGLYWQRFGTSVPIATTSVAGIVKPDGTTISVGLDGTIEVKIDGESIFIDDEDDKIKAKLSTLADVDITDLEDGYVLAWDATAEKFVAVEKGGGGILPHLIIITEPNETSVKAVKGQTEIVAVETSTGHYECDLPEFGTWTVHAILNGEDAQVSLVVDTVKVYTVDDSHFHSDITVSFPSGGSCSCAQSGQSTLYANTNPYTFTVHHDGIWTLTCTADGKTYTQTVNATATGQTFSVTLPVGATVTPTDDIEILVHCAGLSASEIDDLSDLFADSTTLLAVTSSHNAVDYLVRSTSFTTANGIVPTMTSNTAPSGIVSASETYSTYYSWYPFSAYDETEQSSGLSHMWEANSASAWIQYQFTYPIAVNKVKVCQGVAASRTMTITVQGSNDGTTWDDLTETTVSPTNHVREHSFINNSAYEYYRLSITSNDGFIVITKIQFYATSEAQGFCDNSIAMTDIGANNYCADTLLADSTWLNAICNSAYFENVLNVKVPTMTSNTTPSGVASALSEAHGSAYYAFDNDSSTQWRASMISSGATSANTWIQYEFPSPVKCFIAKYSGASNMPVQSWSIDGSDDGSTFTTLGSGGVQSGYNDVKLNLTQNIDYYTHYRFSCTQKNNHTAQAPCPTLYTLQFYGRAQS